MYHPIPNPLSTGLPEGKNPLKKEVMRNEKAPTALSNL